MVTTSWTYDVTCFIEIQISFVEKYKMRAFNKAITYGSSYRILLLFLLFLGSSRVIFFKNHH